MIYRLIVLFKIQKICIFTKIVITMNHGKLLYSTKVDGMKSANDCIHVGVYGIFNSTPGNGVWRYYLISFTQDAVGKIKQLTPEWVGDFFGATIANVIRYSKEIQNLEDGIKACDEYKTKWVTGSNNTVQQKRDEKLTEILK